MRAASWPPLLLILCVLAACGTDDETTTPGTPSDTTVQEETHAYQVFLRGGVQDTLRGDAAFGHVVHPKTQNERFVIELKTSSGVGDGLYLIRSDTLLPSAGTYELASAADSIARADGRFALVYREGVRRQLTSREGTMTITEASDSLLVGSLEARLYGFVSEDAEAMQEGEEQQAGEVVHARGQFRAEAGSVGYLIGL